MIDSFYGIRHITGVLLPCLGIEGGLWVCRVLKRRRFRCFFPFDTKPASSRINNGLLLQAPQQQLMLFCMAEFVLTASQQYIRIFDDRRCPGVNIERSAVVNDKIAVIRIDVVSRPDRTMPVWFV